MKARPRRNKRQDKFLSHQSYKNIYRILLAILLLAIFLRFHPLADDIGTDEGKYALGIDYPGSSIISGILYRIQFLLGFDENILRAITILFSLFTMLVSYKIGELIDVKFGLLNAFAIAVLPTNIIMSRTVFLDIYMLFFLSLAIYSYLRLTYFRDEDLNPKTRLLSRTFLSRVQPSRMQLSRIAYLLVLFFSVMITAMIKPQGALIIVPFFIFGFIRLKWSVIKRPEYYSIAFAMLPFITNYLANPQRFGDLLTYFTGSSNIQSRGAIFDKILGSFSFMSSSDGLLWILVLLGLIVAVYYAQNKENMLNKKNLVDMKNIKNDSKFATTKSIANAKKNNFKKGIGRAIMEKDLLTFMMIFFIFMALIYIFVLLTTYYYLIYLNLFEAFFIAYILYVLIAKASIGRTLKYVAIPILLILFLIYALNNATGYLGNKSVMYERFADKDSRLFQENRFLLNKFLSDQPIAVIGGNFGHQYQYYIEKPVFRSCILKDGVIASNVNKAIVTNMTDLNCKETTDMILTEWVLVKEISGHEDKLLLFVKDYDVYMKNS